MKNRCHKLFLFLSVICFFTGCKTESSEEINMSLSVDNSEENVSKYIDDTYYVPDLFGILMLCEGNELPNYEKNIQLLKGDKKSVEKAIENLSTMEQTPEILNAIGVGCLRLDQCDEGTEKLNEALFLTEDDSEKVCILNNLGNYRLCTPENIVDNSILSRYEQALEIVSDPVKKIIICMNKIGYGPLLYLNEEEPIEYALKEFEQLLKDEKKVLGSNQIVGIYAYPSLFLFLTENEEEEIWYLEEAIRMNHKLYQYRAADVLCYQGLMGMYHATEDYEKALEYADKLIETVDGFLSDSDPYLTVAYYDKARILIDEEKYDEAIQCINILIEKENLRLRYRMNSYLKLGEIHYLQDDYIKAEEMVQEAYEIFLKIKKEEMPEIDINKILEMYSDDDYYHSNPEYTEWLEEQLEKHQK